MKTLKKLLFTALFTVAVFALSAQTPPHPNGGNAPGGGSTPVGGGAPIGGGLLIILSLAIGYGAKKVYDGRKNILDA